MTWLVTVHEKGAAELPEVTHGVDTHDPNDPVSPLRTLTCTSTIAPAGEMPEPVKVLCQSFAPGVLDTEPAKTGGADGLGVADGDGELLGGVDGVADGVGAVGPVVDGVGVGVGVSLGSGVGVASGSEGVGVSVDSAAPTTVTVTDDSALSLEPSKGCST